MLWIVLGLFLVLLLMLRTIAVFWTDFLWFDSIQQTAVWRTLIFTRVWLVLAASLVAFALFWLNLALADRLSPRMRTFGDSPDDELLDRFQEWVTPRVGWVRLLVAAFFGIMLGLSAAVWWEDWLLFRYGGDFGIADPIFNNDIGRYVFQLPFYRSLFTWAFQLVLVITLATAGLHYLNGGIRVGGESRRVNPGVKVHLSILLALLALLKAVGYTLDQWQLLYSTNGGVIGASFTDVNARLPALRLLVLISLVAAVILLVNLRFRGWTLPAVALGLWLVTSVVVGGLYPFLIQRLRVEPDEINKEAEYVAHNIEFTRNAYGLADVTIAPFAASPDLDAEQLADNTDTLENIRLWDPGVLETTYRELQEIRTFYGIEDVDVDRYMVDGKLTQVMVSARELDENSIPGGGWVNERLVYTHGFGAVLSPANEVTPEGRPSFLVQDIPPISTEPSLAIPIDGSRIYFSDAADTDYVVGASKQEEVDYPIGESGDNVQFNTYEGEGGVELGGVFTRFAWFLRFGELDTLISGQLSSDSKVLLVRNVRERVKKVAPFLFADADAYPVVIGGEIKWIVDLYTITNWYPYSTDANTSRLERVPGLPDQFNYIRNSVKAVVDAEDGTIDLYVVDAEDPLIQAQQRIFPSLFMGIDQMPADLQEHLRYPEDLFRVQSDQYRFYHVTDPQQFLNNVDPWQIARDPSTSPRPDLRFAFRDENNNPIRPMLPYYLLMALPNEDELSFLIMQPFTPQGRPNMVSFLVATSDGQITSYNLPADRAQPGPNQVGDFINQDTEISAQFTLLGQAGSAVIQGSMLVIPIEESLIYVQPIYITADQSNGAPSPTGVQPASGTTGIPEFNSVVVSFDGRVEIAASLDDALGTVFSGFGGTGSSSTVDEDGQPVEVPEQIAALVAQAEAAFMSADAALRDGDLVAYAEQIATAERLVAEANRLISTLPISEP